jgi:hypothetical protein
VALLPRVGRLAVQTRQAGFLGSAFDLRTLSTVFVRISASEAQSAVELHRRACVPGVAPVLDHGSDSELAWVAVPAEPTRLSTLLDGGLKLSWHQALTVAADGVRLLHALALAGVSLPDLRPERVQLDITGVRPQLILGDLSGATEGTTEVSVAVAWCRGALSWPPFRGQERRSEVTEHIALALEGAESLPALIDALRDD